MRKADNLTTMPLSRNLGTLTSWNPLGLSRPVMGLILFIYFITPKHKFKICSGEENILLIPGSGTTKIFPRTATDLHLTHCGTRKQSHYRSGQTLRVPEEVGAPTFKDSRHTKVLTFRPLLSSIVDVPHR